MCEISLTQGKFALVDEDVFLEIGRDKWHAARSGLNYYAKRNIQCVNGKQKTERMHSWIMKAPRGLLVDHINGDTLDNRRENLRIVTSRENCQNRHTAKSSIYPGVNWLNLNKRWWAWIWIKGKSKSLGYFDSEIGAFMAYLRACVGSGFPIECLLQKYEIKMEDLINE